MGTQAGRAEVTFGAIAGAAWLSLAAGPAAGQDRPADLPVRVIDRDNVRITESCTIVIRDGLAIADDDGNGVIHVGADGITIAFAPGTALRGKLAEDIRADGWDTLTGTGIRLEGHRGVTIRDARVHGYRVGLRAERCDGLTLDRGDFSDNFRARLASTALREGNNWMSPHRNDNDEWIGRYGGAVYIENASGVTVRGLHIRRGQHGILLDEVTDSRVYDNDASFLSGWGLAMFRSGRNLISRNAFDFCVRGHVEGVFNRGQDSAGILAFEQCSENIFVENSATHGGDGFFGFGGLDALGQDEFRENKADRARAGCNDNIFMYNDFSYAPAHGLELTFSFGNIIARNRFEQNAICGIWGGYSQDTLIAENLFAGNSGMPYGIWERGGVNFEHARNVRVLNNRFEDNRVGVHFWWRDPAGIRALAWGKDNTLDMAGNVIAANTFVMTDTPMPFPRTGADETRDGVWLTDLGRDGNIPPVVVADNAWQIATERARRTVTPEGTTEVRDAGGDRDYTLPEPEAIGDTRPVIIRNGIPLSRRAFLAGRHNIIMDEWGPWDHTGTAIRIVRESAGERTFEVFGVRGPLEAELRSDGANVTVQRLPGDGFATIDRHLVSIGAGPGIHPYRLTLAAPGFTRTVEGTLIGAEWACRAFRWTDDTDPRTNLDAWTALAEAPGAVRFTTDSIDMPFGWGSPSTLDLGDNVRAAAIPGDRFGLIADTTLRLPAGDWRITTVSDDGVRVLIDGEPVIDNWTWHGPTTDTAVYRVDRERSVSVRLMHFEIDGFSTISFSIERAG